MNTDLTYNGWTNYATWNVNLWCDNESGMYFRKLNLLESLGHPCTAFDAETIAIAVLGERGTPDLSGPDSVDEPGWRWQDVNWEEIAEHWADEIAEGN